MGEWYCFKCKEKMAEKDISGTYLEITRFIRGLQCPRCKTAYLSEQITVDEVNKGEEEIEAKL